MMRSAGQEDNLPNIKGDLFESLMFPLLRLIYPDAVISPGEELKEKKEDDSEQKFEYDYIVTSPRINEIVVVELKGYSSTNYISLGDYKTRNTISWFFGNSFPFAKAILKVNEPNRQIKASFITTAGFKEDGMFFLEQQNKTKLRSSQLEVWYDGKKLMELLQKHQLRKTQEILRKYYIKKGKTDEDEDTF